MKIKTYKQALEEKNSILNNQEETREKQVKNNKLINESLKIIKTLKKEL